MKEPLEHLTEYYASLDELQSQRPLPEMPESRRRWLGWWMPLACAALAYGILALCSVGAESPGQLPRPVLERQMAGAGFPMPPVQGTSSTGRREA